MGAFISNEATDISERNIPYAQRAQELDESAFVPLCSSIEFKGGGSCFNIVDAKVCTRTVFKSALL